MSRPYPNKVVTIAGWCTVVLFAASVVSCGFGDDGGGINIGAVVFAFVLVLLALGSLTVWVTARDMAGDEPHNQPRRTGSTADGASDTRADTQ